MEWPKAKRNIKNKVGDKTNLQSRRSGKRPVTKITDNGFKVEISEISKVTIKVTWKMLEKCWKESMKSGYYGNCIFKKHFEEKQKQHPCYVHVVGKIFEVAGLAKNDGNCYRII